MTPISTAQIRKIMPAAGDAARLYAGPLDAAMARFHLDQPRRAAAFLANLAHESAQLVCVEENLRYSAVSLMRTWKSRFPADVAAEYALKPERIANRAYADRMGNGNEASGDGWRYRGRGPIQLTGRDNYRTCGHAIGYDLEAHPELLTQPEVGALAAAWFWSQCGANKFADAGDFDGACDEVNRGRKTAPEGDAIGYKERKKFWDAAREVLKENCESGETL